ncbi:glycerophosphodiester phosphodiesterase family protein [uncultured Marinobacter sp.]|uniref:glycerophosphodiester phosphodiesterase family protein n=1 Tax=uncultured Marinobacter sp. TaxID=187379 RepID=UPI0030D9F368
MSALVRTAAHQIADHWRSLLLYYLLFTTVALALLSPLFSALLTIPGKITGEAAISTAGIIEFAFSPGGLLWLLLTLTLTVFSFMLQQSGMTLIAAVPRYSGNRRQEIRTLLAALRGTIRRIRAIFVLAVIQTTAHLLLALPFLAVLAISYELLLASYDVYYLRVEQPPVLWLFYGIALLAGVCMLACNSWLFMRWLLAVPLLMTASAGVTQALTASAAQVKGHRRKITLPLVAGLVSLAALPALFTILYQAMGAPLLNQLPDQSALVVPVMVVYLAIYLLATLVIAFIAMAGFSMIVLAATEQLPGRQRGATEQPPANAGPMAWGVEVLLLILVVSQASLIVHSFDPADSVTNTAHRGASLVAPENSLSAILQAIADGADYIEIDVRLTADKVPVLWHDSDMRRVFGLEGAISGVSLEEVMDRDAGSWFNAGFSGQRIVTLQEAIDAVRGKAGLYVDLKPDLHTPELTQKVIELLQHNDMIEHSILAAAQPGILREAKWLEPDLETTLLAQFVVGPLDSTSFDNLGLRHNRVNAATIAEAHRKGYELHVWTVNSASAMARFMDMGVDNIITDRPDLLTGLIEQRTQRTPTERLLMTLHNWLR